MVTPKTNTPTGSNLRGHVSNLNFNAPGSTYLWSLFNNTTNVVTGVNFTVPLVLNGNLSVTTGSLLNINFTSNTISTASIWTTTDVTNSWVLMQGTNASIGSGLNFSLNFIGLTNGFSYGAFSLSTNASSQLVLNYFLPSTINWTATSGNWAASTNWSNSINPLSNSTVAINNGGTANITNAAGTIANLIIGTNGSSNALVITAPGSLNVTSNTVIGAGTNASNNSLVINGGGLTNGGNLIIGSNGSSNSMLIAGGGSAVASNTIIGAGASASNNTLTVNNGSLSNSGNLYVGSNGPNNSLVIGSNSNSTVTAANTYIGFGSNSTGNLLSVNGGTLSNSGSIQMGGSGGSGTLSLNNGGQVYATNIVIYTNSTLGGNGTVNAAPGGVSVMGGTIAPTGTNVLVINGNLNFNAPGSTYLWSLFNNTTNGQGTNFTAPLQLNGTLSVTTGSIFAINLANLVNVTNPFWTNNQTWTVMNGGNVSAGTNFATAVASGSITEGFLASEFSFITNGNTLELVYTAPITTIVTNAASTNVVVTPNANNNVVQNGTGTTTLSGSNASALTIIVNNGTLAANNPTGTLADLVNVTVNGGTFGVQGGGSNTVNGFTVNGGTVVVASNAVVVATNPTGIAITGGNLSGGTYQAANYTFTPSNTANVSAVLGNLNTNSWALVSNAVSGTPGTTIFNSEMTYSGGTLITNATLQIGSGSLTGSLLGFVTNNGTLQNGSSGALSLTNLATNITGTGIIAQAGTGTLTLSLAPLNGFTGSFAVSTNGTMAVTNTADLGGGTNIYLANNGTLQLAGSVTNFSAPVVVTNGTGIIQNSGSGSLTLSGDLTKLNRTLVLSGSNIAVTGRIIGRDGVFNSDLVVSNGTVLIVSAQTNYFGPTLINNASTLTIGTNNALPTDTVVILGTGTDSNNNTFDMAGHNQSLAGLTSPTNASSVNLVTNGVGASMLTLNDTLPTNTTYGGLIAGNIALIRLGTGTITLTQNNTFTGGTTIISGGIVSRNAGALGTGIVTMNGGALSVQNQSLQISSLVWNGGVIALPHAGSGIYLISTGALTLAGLTHQFDLSGATLTIGTPTALLGATNIMGYSTNNFTVAGVGNYELLLSSNTLWINLLGSPIPTPVPSGPAYPNFVIPGLTPNQSQVAGAMNKWASNNPTGDQVIVINALTNISSSEWAAAYDQMSPRYYQQMSTIAFNLANAQNNELVQRMFGLRVSGTGFSMSGFADNIAILEGQGDSVLDTQKDILRPGADTHWGMFVDGNGMFGSANSGNMLPNYNFQSGGITTGLTYQWSDTFLTGLYAGYQGAYAKNAGLGTLIDNSVRFGLISTYGSASGKGFYADALLGGGYNNYQVSRTIQFGSINRTANSSPGAGELDSMIAAGYNWKKGNWAFGPIGSLQYTYFGMNSFNETGAQSLNLNNQGWNASSMISSLGANCAYSWQAKKDVMVVPQINLGWQHEFMQNSYAINSTMGGTPYSNSSAAPIRDTLYTGVGVTVEFKKTWNTAFFYNASAGNSDLQSQNIFWSIGRKF